MRHLKLSFSVVVISVLLLTACNFPDTASTSTANQLDAVNTAAAQTVAALSTQISTVSAPTAQATAVLPTLVPSTAIPSATPMPSLTAITIPMDAALFVTDVTIPDNTLFSGGETFTKTWRLKNVGTSTWTSSYALVFYSGDAMSGPASVPLSGSVSPGSTINISATLKAPTTNKTYVGNWMLRNASGALFGLGAAANVPFYVKIVVGSTATPSVFAVISVPTSVDSATKTCPATFTFTAKIKVNKAGTVTYHWVRSKDSSPSTTTLTFSGAGEQTVTDTWSFLNGIATYNGWEQIYIDSPNHQGFGKVTFTLNCVS